MKIEVSKQNARLIDEAKNLQMINKLRNLLHQLMEGLELEDYDNYLTTNELLNELESIIWSRIEDFDEESLLE